MMLRLLIIVLSLSMAPIAGARDYAPNYDNINNQRWRCRLCPFESTTTREVSTGIINVTDSEARFGRDTGLKDEGSELSLDGKVVSRQASGSYWSIVARQLALDARQIDIQAGKSGRYDWTISWREIPRNTWTHADTPYQGRTELTLPTNWIAAFSTSELDVLNESLQTLSFGTHRKRAHIGGKVNLSSHWVINAAATRETREGNKESSSDFFNLAAAMPMPIDYETDDLKANVVYQAKQGLISLGVNRSTFSNHDRSLIWQNAYPSFNGETRGRKGLAPSNEASGWSLDTQYRWGNTTISASHRDTEMTQNDAFLPYTINTQITTDTLPALRLHGKVDSRQNKLSISSRITRRFSIDLRIRSHERVSGTPILALAPIVGDAFSLGDKTSRAYSFEHNEQQLQLHYRLFSGTRLTLGYEQDERERTRSEIEENEEDRLSVKLVSNTYNGLRLALTYEDADRNASDFQAITNNNPLTVRYHQATRNQTRWRAHVDYQVPNAPVSLSGYTEQRDNDYPNSALGLQQDEDSSWGLDISYQPSDTLSISASHQDQTLDSVTFGSNSFSVRDWTSSTLDQVRTTIFDIEKTGLLCGRLDLTLSYIYSDGAGQYDTEFLNQSSRFPALASEHRGIDFTALYRATEKLSVKLRYYNEDYRSADWALDGVTNDTIRNVIGMNLVSPNYGISLTNISFTYAL
jgi:MtrB/PioB family decaheme-associated outer membrane protein